MIHACWFKKGSDPWLTLGVFMLMLWSMIMLMSIYQGSSAGQTILFLKTTLKQAVYVLFSVLLMIFFSHMFRYRTFGRLRFVLIAGYLLVVGYTAGFGQEISGSRAWLNIGSLSLQPSEFGKLLSIVTMAYALFKARKEPERAQSFWHTFRLPLTLMVLNTVAVVLQKDFGSLVIYLGINVICLLVPAGPAYKKAQFLIKAAVFAGVVSAGILIGSDQINEKMASVPFLSHISTRISNMKDPYTDIYAEGYQPANALYSMAEGGIMGEGLGNSTRKYGYLTQADSDYIFAIIIEETGAIGLVWVTGWNMLIWYRLFYYAFKATWRSDKVLLCGTAAWFMLHFIVNVGGVGMLIPMTGVPLLMISKGGSALFASAMAIGVCQNRISKIDEHQKSLEKNRLSRQS